MRSVVLLLALTACAGGAHARPSPVVADGTATAGRADERAAEGERLFGLGRLEEAEAIFIELAQDPLADPSDRGFAWWRIGETNFELGRLDRAEAAYARALGGLSSEEPWRGVVLYKWAWTAYRDDRYRDALERFTLVLATPVPEGRSVLWVEALEYMAILVAEDDWDGDGAPDAVVGLDRPEVVAWQAQLGSVPWLATFYERLASFFEDLALPERAAVVRSRAPLP